MNKRKNIYRQYILLVLALLLPYLAIAQNVISGKVTDAGTGEPLIGATVIVKTDKKHGVATDVDGNFRLQTNKELPLTLHLDFVGYRGLDVDVYDVSEPVSIQLKENYKFLNGVVVVGYGTQKKSDISGAVASVNVDNIKNVAGSSFNSLLGGTTPGLRVTPTSGQPGGSVSLRVRGGSSIQGGNEPLYVIDGFPIYNDKLSSGTFTSSVSSHETIDPLASINPGDIESITVLKDASATAISGSRGANGVVIITTKRGKSGEKAQISYSGSFGFQRLLKKIDVLNAKEFAELKNDALYDTNPLLGKYQYKTQDEIDALGDGTDWQDAAYRSAIITNHQLTISGGTDKTRYAVSGNYFNQDGILINTGFNRLSARVNLDSKVSKKFTVGLNLTASKTENKTPPTGAVFSLLQIPATATIYDKDGSYTLKNDFDTDISNPIAALNEDINKSRTYRLLGTAYGEYEFIKDLKLKVSFGVDVNSTKDYSYIPSTVYEGSKNNGIATLGYIDVSSWLNENTLTYSKTFSKKHNFSFLLGYTQQKTEQEIVRTGSYNYVSDALTYNSLQSGSVTSTPYSYSASNSLLSYLGRANYNYDDKHFVSLSLRRDGSSRFGKDRKWGTFPSVGYSYNVIKETFLQQFNNVLSNLKVRLSYGKTGNQEIGNYQSLSTLSSSTYIIGNKVLVGYAPDRISNEDLGWETTYQFDAGLDIGFFSDRLNFTLDYYYKKTKDLLLNVSIPYTSGYESSLQNYGSVSNKGLEFAINSKNFIGKFNWDTSANIAFNRNKIVDIGGASSTYITTGIYESYIIQQGQSLGAFYGAVYDGVLQTGEESTKGKYTYNQSATAGDRLYKDINGDGKFTNAEDRTVIGKAEPDFTFGITNNFSYKGFDLSVFINGSVGNDIANINKERLSLFSGQQNAIGLARDRWTTTNASTIVSRAKYDPSTVFSSEFIEDGSFMRVKNVALGYTFPTKVIKSIGLSGLRLYVSLTNLFTITGYSGYDPEVTSSDNALTAGTDSGAYPSAKTYNFGVVVDF